MEIDELRYFLAVSKFENVNRAAEHIHISPGSLSKAISRLEKELGVDLFTRVGRGLQITNEGKQLRKRALEVDGSS